VNSAHVMRPIATDGEAWSVGLSVCVCLLVTAEPIEMPFGGWLGWTQWTMN